MRSRSAEAFALVVLLLFGATVAAGCGGSRPPGQHVHLAGLSLDVSRVGIKIVAAADDCSAPALATATVDAAGGGADATVSLPAGTYRLCVTPLDMTNAPSTQCASFEITFTVGAGASEIGGSARCDAGADGGAAGQGGAAAGAGGGGGAAGAGGGARGGAGGPGGGGAGAAGTGGAGGLGGASGSFQCHGIAWADDFDGDGMSDCAIEVPGSTASLRGIEFHKGMGPGSQSTTFATAGVVTPDALPSSHSLFGTIDLTGDGRADILEIAATPVDPMYTGAGYQLLRGNADGTFARRSTGANATPPTGNGVFQQYRADFNKDGRTDLLLQAWTRTTTGEARWYTLSCPSGCEVVQIVGSDATSVINTGSNGSAAVSAVGDFNSDGNLDLVVVVDFIPLITANRRTSIGVALGAGNGKFASTTTVPGTDGLSNSAMAADANGDGKLDLLVMFRGVDGGAETMQTFYGDGAGNFSPTPP